MAASGSPQAPRSESPASSPRLASVSLQAAAALNAELVRRPSRHSSNSSLSRTMNSPQAERRRSAVHMGLQLNDPSVPAPGEMLLERGMHPLTADPHHHRIPSLGDLHQELEAEQESHVNRLLLLIREQQLELQRLQSAQHAHGSGDEPAAPQPISPPTTHQVPSLPGSYSHSPVLPYRGPADASRRSRTPSRGPSPRVRATSISAESGDWVLGGRDESAFYQAETQMLMRENQMLRHRIRELEKQISESQAAANPSEPPVPSRLTRSPTLVEGSDQPVPENQ